MLPLPKTFFPVMRGASVVAGVLVVPVVVGVLVVVGLGAVLVVRVGRAAWRVPLPALADVPAWNWKLQAPSTRDMAMRASLGERWDDIAFS